jgi:hypothetical protein
MRNEREIRSFIRDMGGETLSIRRGKHWVCRAIIDGVELRVVLPFSASDPRSLMNCKMDTLRRVRMIKEGMLDGNSRQ